MSFCLVVRTIENNLFLLFLNYFPVLKILFFFRDPKNNLHFEKAYDACAAYNGLLYAHNEGWTQEELTNDRTGILEKCSQEVQISQVIYRSNKQFYTEQQ
jgi:hypothetical protein